MTSLCTATLELAKVVGNVQTSVSTGAGSATTIVDTAMTQPDDYWNGGTLFILTGAHADKSRKITDWVKLTGTYTIPTTTTAVGLGQTYAVVTADWPQNKLVEFVNRALRRIGDIATVDTSLTVLADTHQYTLPAGVRNVVKVEQANSNVAPYLWQTMYTWQEVNGVLYFTPGREPQAVGYLLRLTYMAPHAAVAADADLIDDQIHLDLLTAAASVDAWRWHIQLSREDQPIYQAFYSEAIAKEAIERVRHPIYRPTRAPKLSL